MGYSQFAPDGVSWAFHWGLHSLAWDWNRPSPLQPQRTTQICSIATSIPASTPLHFNSPGLHLSSCNSWEPPNPSVPTLRLTHILEPWHSHTKTSTNPAWSCLLLKERTQKERRGCKMTKMMRTDGSATCLASKGKPEFSPQQNILREQKDSLPLKHALFLFEKKKKKNKKILNTFSFSCRKHSCCTTETHILLMHFQHKTELGRMDFKSTKDSKIHTQAVLSTYTHAVIHREKPNTWIQPSSTARWGEASREGPELSCSGALPLQYHYSQLLSMACKFSAYSPS